MDIPALSMEISKINLSNQVGIELLKMAKDQMEVSGEQLISLMDSAMVSAEPHLGGQLDLRL